MLDFIYLLNLKSWNDWYQERLYRSLQIFGENIHFRSREYLISSLVTLKPQMFSFHCTNSTLSHAQVGHLSVHLLKNGFKAHIHFFGDLDYRFF